MRKIFGKKNIKAEDTKKDVDDRYFDDIEDFADDEDWALYRRFTTRQPKRSFENTLKKGLTASICLCSITLAGIMFYLAGTAINIRAVKGAVANMERATKEAKAELVQTIEHKVDEVSNFDVNSFELFKAESKYICKAFGVTSAEEIVGIKKNNYLNLLFEISKQDAKDILGKVKKVDETKKVASYDSPEHSLKHDNINYSHWGEEKKVKKLSSALVEVYNAIDSAVQNAYGYEIEKVAETSQFNNKIASSYRYSKPENLTDAKMFGLFSKIDTRFINGGLVTTGITSVLKDQEKNESYFYIDTIQVLNTAAQGEDGSLKLASCRARVAVEGANLSQEEVYAKFINGEHKSFVEIVREKIGPKTGIYKGQVCQDVEEIELS